MPIDTTKTGAAIAAFRQRMNLSQQGLAGLMNVTHQAVSKWEKGLALPDTETLLALAKLFGTSMEDLLMGVLPKEPDPVPEEEPLCAEAQASSQEILSEEPPVSIPADEISDLDFSSIMNMLPFVSTKTADLLFKTYSSGNTPDAGKLIAIAPFVSTRVLGDYISTHSFENSSPEVVASLAPFLPAKAVDDLVLGMEAPIPDHIVQMLMPFASTRVADQMVLGRLGIHVAQSDAQEAAQTPSPLCESPRTHLIHKAIEKGNYAIIESLFDELDGEAYRLLLKELDETGNAKLLELFCKNIRYVDPGTQFELAQLLINGKMYNELAEVIEALPPAWQRDLLDQAFEINDPELLHTISKHL